MSHLTLVILCLALCAQVKASEENKPDKTINAESERFTDLLIAPPTFDVPQKQQARHTESETFRADDPDDAPAHQSFWGFSVESDPLTRMTESRLVLEQVRQLAGLIEEIRSAGHADTVKLLLEEIDTETLSLLELAMPGTSLTVTPGTFQETSMPGPVLKIVPLFAQTQDAGGVADRVILSINGTDFDSAPGETISTDGRTILVKDIEVMTDGNSPQHVVWIMENETERRLDW